MVMVGMAELAATHLLKIVDGGEGEGDGGAEKGKSIVSRRDHRCTLLCGRRYMLEKGMHNQPEDGAMDNGPASVYCMFVMSIGIGIRN